MKKAEGALLLEAARASIAEAFGGPKPIRPDQAWLEAPGACFVTLRKGDALRGCIGSVHARRGLFEDVVENAKASAFHDPRFAPLTEAELDAVTIELSVLTPLELLQAESEDAALAQITPGLHGVHLSWAGRSALFIPAVWEQLPEPREFFQYLRRKAGLPPGWLPGTRVSRFTALKFEEEDVESQRPLVARAR